jgi:agmatinase
LGKTGSIIGIFGHGCKHWQVAVRLDHDVFVNNQSSIERLDARSTEILRSCISLRFEIYCKTTSCITAMKSPFKCLGVEHNFLALTQEFSAFDSSKIAIVSAPYARTTTRVSGTKKAPEAILRASHHLQIFDEETKREVAKEIGIATLQPLNLGAKNEESALQTIHETILSLISLNKFVVTLGGDNAISSAVTAAFAKKIDNLSILQFDAHSDLQDGRRDAKRGDAGVMAKVCEFLDPSKLVQVGVRSQNKEEAEFARDNNVRLFYAHEIHGGSHTRLLKYWDDAVVDRLSENVYVTFDVDVFDPSIMPATPSPEPGGLSWFEVMRCLKKVGKKRRIVGFDVVEFAPIKSLPAPDLTVAKLVSKMINYAL